MSSDRTILEQGKKTLSIEAAALYACCECLDNSFVQAIRMIFAATTAGGRVIITGLGKSGHIGEKIASTLSSTGTPSFFLHASEALHGDFGMIGKQDILLAIAHGGQTREVLAVCQYARESGHSIIAITGAPDSHLSELSDCVLNTRVTQEADALGLAPTASTAVAMGMGDALASALMHLHNFTEQHFARLHPGGSLGRSLQLVKHVMKSRKETPTLNLSSGFHNILESVTSPNFGVVCIVDHFDKVLGSITDGDLRRALLSFGSDALSMTASRLMNHKPRKILPEAKAIDAVNLMEKYKITSLFVVSSDDTLMGLVRLHDLMSGKFI